MFSGQPARLIASVSAAGYGFCLTAFAKDCSLIHVWPLKAKELPSYAKRKPFLCTCCVVGARRQIGSRLKLFCRPRARHCLDNSSIAGYKKSYQNRNKYRFLVGTDIPQSPRNSFAATCKYQLYLLLEEGTRCRLRHARAASFGRHVADQPTVSC